MDRHYYGAKVLLVVLGLIVAGMGAMAPSGYKSPMAHLHYGAAVQVEAAMLRTGAKFTHAALQFIHRLGGL